MALPARTDALDVIVELLTELDQEPGSGPGFYDRLCAALCRVTDMERASLLLYDEARQLVVPVGSHGIESGILEDIYGTLEETPIAQVALSEDRVVEVHGELERWVPERYAGIGGVDTITCTPVSAGGRWLGVVFADRGGGHFTLAEDERHAMWTLGKTAALAASVRIATSQQGRAPLVQARIDLAREIPPRVGPRPFGGSLVLGSGATTRSCRWSSTGSPGWRCRTTLSRSRNPCSRRRFATPTSTPTRPASASAWAASTAPSCSRCETTVPSRDRAARAAPGWGCAWPRPRRSAAARSWSSVPRAPTAPSGACASSF